LETTSCPWELIWKYTEGRGTDRGFINPPETNVVELEMKKITKLCPEN
jgi:hypothetical protein